MLHDLKCCHNTECLPQVINIGGAAGNSRRQLWPTFSMTLMGHLQKTLHTTLKAAWIGYKIGYILKMYAFINSEINIQIQFYKRSLFAYIFMQYFTLKPIKSPGGQMYATMDLLITVVCTYYCLFAGSLA